MQHVPVLADGMEKVVGMLVCLSAFEGQKSLEA